MTDQTNFELLQAHGVLETPAHDDVIAQVNSLSREEILALVAVKQKVGFQGTPGIVFKNGSVVKGFVEAPKLEELLAKK